MRYLLIMLSLISLSLCQFLPNDEDIAKMSPYEKQMLFERYDKNPLWNSYLQFFTPTYGYARINQWKRGLKFLGAEVSALLLGSICNALSMAC